MNHSPLVSVVVPCYNGEKFVDACFGSLLAQTYKNLEIIAVDDGSADDSGRLIRSYADAFKKNGMTLKYIWQENRGLGGAVDTGLKHVTGEFLHLLDIDDLLLPEAVEAKLIAAGEHPDAAVIRSDAYIVTEKNTEDTSLLLTQIMDGAGCENLFFRLLMEKTYPSAGSYMVKTKPLFDFYPDRNIYPSRQGQNLQILLPLAYRYKSAFVNKPLMKYIRYSSSMSAVGGNTAGLRKKIGLYEGYRDIRLYMIDAVEKDPLNNAALKNLVEAYYARLLLELYAELKDKNGAKNSFKTLKKTDKPTKNDRYLYFSAKYPMLSRLYNRLKR